MISYYTADYLMPVDGAPVKGGVVAFNEEGVVQGVYERSDQSIAGKELIHHSGILIPGFVNTHCHLELSHMKGIIPRETGLPDFLQRVMSDRGAEENVIQAAMLAADQEMYANGIQAVGDHANTARSAQVKANSPIYYHTFVELLGLSQAGVQERVDQARDVEYDFEPQPTSITPHAPYSCSKELFKAIGHMIDRHNILSIHNQESEEENKLFRYLKGDFLNFYTKNNIPYNHLKAQGKNSLQTCVPLLPEENALILVHNTYTSVRDIDYLKRIGRDVYYCFCPKANDYIEKQWPRIQNFVLSKQKIVLGTDSLASNDTLSILEELKLIHQHMPDLLLETSLVWATLAGAEALGIAEQYGSLTVGKKPGLVLLENTTTLALHEGTSIQRIV